MDNLSGPEAAFSIGNILEAGLEHNRLPGEWQGPSTMVQIFERLNETYKPFPDLVVVSFPEGVVYRDRIEAKAFLGGDKGKVWTPTVVLVGFRLGLDKINAEYYPALLRLMRSPRFVGISGGQGNGALYFVGNQGDHHLIFLDPHVTQKAVGRVEDLWAEHMSYHYHTPLKLPIGQLNTSLAYGTRFEIGGVGFYVRTAKDYEDFVAEMTKEMKAQNGFVQIYDKEITYDLGTIRGVKKRIVEPIHEEVLTISTGDKKDVFIVY